MGKTLRRGGAERGYYSPGKSLRDKRQRGTNRAVTNEDTYDKYQSKIKPKKSYFEEDQSWKN